MCTIKARFLSWEKASLTDINSAYKASSDLWQEYKDADEMFKRATTTMDYLSSVLEFVVPQPGGAKMYRCHLLENHYTNSINVPLKKSHLRLKSLYYKAPYIGFVLN